MTATTDLHSLLQDLAALGEEQNLGPVMVERIKRAREGAGETRDLADDFRTIETFFKNAEDAELADETYSLCPLRAEQALASIREAIASAPPAPDTAPRVGDDALPDRSLVLEAVERTITSTENLIARIEDHPAFGGTQLDDAKSQIELWKAVVLLLKQPALASIPTPTGRAEALEEAAKFVLRESVESGTVFDRALAIRPGEIELLPTSQAKDLAKKIRALSSAPTQAVTVDDARVRAFATELRKWWSFDDGQMHTRSWHTREDFIAKKLPELLSPDPTRAALEELVRTLKCTNGEHSWSLHGRSGNEPAYICGRCATVWSNSRIVAFATARNALQGE